MNQYYRQNYTFILETYRHKQKNKNVRIWADRGATTSSSSIIPISVHHRIQPLPLRLL